MHTQPATLAIGATAPVFDLPATDGRRYQLADFDAPVFVYIQGSNQCPVVRGYLGRLAALAADYGPRGVQFVMVNSNDAERFPEESFAAMQAFADEFDLPYPYLQDDSQEVAQAYRTVRTPEVLVFDQERRLAYHGRIDDNAKEPEQVTQRELAEALEALLAGEPVSEPETFAVGCTIKWRPGNEPLVG